MVFAPQDQNLINWIHKLVFINGVLGVLLNIPLILLIIFRSRPEFGTYKYLLLIFASFNVTYPFFHMFINPGLHVYKRSYVLFADPLIPFEIAHYGLAMWCSCFGMSTMLITYHFIYRYFAVCRPSWTRKVFKHPLGIFSILLIFFAHTFIWFSIYHNQGRYIQEHPEVLHDELMKRFGIDNYKTATVGIMYVKDYIWDNGRNGPLVPMAVLSGGTAITSISISLIIITFCSIRVIGALKIAVNMSYKTRRMQIELFRALIAQTLVPLLVEYIPGLISLTASFFGIYIGGMGNLIILLVSCLPFLDALCMIYFIKDYRNTVSGLLTFPAVGITPYTSSPKAQNREIEGKQGQGPQQYID